jgi:predicted DNA-binding transcriptional regulator AlpA
MLNKTKPAAQIEPAKKAAELKAAGEAKRAQPAWLRLPQQVPATPEVETPVAPERERAADKSQGPPRLLLKSEVCAITGFSFPTIWQWMREGRFPRSRMIGNGGSSKSVWLSTEIEQWMAALPVRRLKGDDVEVA